jgi:hypothetical protein
MKFLLTSIFLLCLFNANTQSLSLKAGGNFNRTIRSSDPGIPGFTFEDFSPKNGFQAGLNYKHPVYKSFFIDAEVGYLNKGHIKRASRTSTVDYNYLTFTPSVGLNLPFGFSIKVGLGINYLLNVKGDILGAAVGGTIDKSEYALTTVLAYNYKRFGLELSHSNNTKAMQRFEFSGIKYENYHEWYAASLSFQLFKKQAKTD